MKAQVQACNSNNSSNTLAALSRAHAEKMSHLEACLLEKLEESRLHAAISQSETTGFASSLRQEHSALLQRQEREWVAKVEHERGRAVRSQACVDGLLAELRGARTELEEKDADMKARMTEDRMSIAHAQAGGESALRTLQREHAVELSLKEAGLRAAFRAEVRAEVLAELENKRYANVPADVVEPPALQHRSPVCAEEETGACEPWLRGFGARSSSSSRRGADVLQCERAPVWISQGGHGDVHVSGYSGYSFSGGAVTTVSGPPGAPVRASWDVPTKTVDDDDPVASRRWSRAQTVPVERPVGLMPHRDRETVNNERSHQLGGSWILPWGLSSEETEFDRSPRLHPQCEDLLDDPPNTVLPRLGGGAQWLKRGPGVAVHPPSEVLHEARRERRAYEDG